MVQENAKESTIGKVLEVGAPVFSFVDAGLGFKAFIDVKNAETVAATARKAIVPEED